MDNHYILCIDESGSMNCWIDIICEYINKYAERIINKKKENKKDKYFLTLIFFNDDVKKCYSKIEFDEYDGFQIKYPTRYKPDGNTALLDAISASLSSIDNNDKNNITIFTDGEENASKIKPDDIKEQITKITNTTMSFIGPKNQNEQILCLFNNTILFNNLEPKLLEESIDQII